MRPRAESGQARGAGPPGALVRRQAGERLLGRLRLPAGRSRRAPGGAHDNADARPRPTASIRAAAPASRSLPRVPPSARWAAAMRAGAESGRPRGGTVSLRRCTTEGLARGSKLVDGSSVSSGVWWQGDPNVRQAVRMRMPAFAWRSSRKAAPTLPSRIHSQSPSIH